MTSLVVAGNVTVVLPAVRVEPVVICTPGILTLLAVCVTGSVKTLPAVYPGPFVISSNVNTPASEVTSISSPLPPPEPSRLSVTVKISPCSY